MIVRRFAPVVFVGLLAISIVGTIPGPALAVLLEPQPRVCTEYFRSDLIFSGTVVDEKQIYDIDGFLIQIIYDLKPIEIFRAELETDIPENERGTPEEVYKANFGDFSKAIIQVRTGVNSGGRQLDVGKSYLLFAGLYDDPDRVAWIVGDGNSALLSEAQAAIAEIKRIQATPAGATGSVRGWIFNYSDPKVKNVRFVATGAGREFEAVTDADGWFEFDLQPGDYQIAPRPPLKDLRPFDLSYDDPENLTVKAGECYEVAFR